MRSPFDSLSTLSQFLNNHPQLLMMTRYISQVRQEIAVRLHARLYPGGEGPSKVCEDESSSALVASVPFQGSSNFTNCGIVLAQLHKEKVHGKELVDATERMYSVS